MDVSDRIRNIEYSPIRKLVPIAEKVQSEGRNIYHLNIGQPDIETPKEFFQAVKNFDEDVLSYSRSQGISSIINSFIEYYNRMGVNYCEDNIMVTNGGSEALIFALLTVCDVGDEILVPEPYYTNYNNFAKIAGVKIVPLSTELKQSFRLPSKDEIVKKITNKTKAILFSNPGNPTGVVYDSNQINAIKEIALENDLFIISDEVYREFVYDGLSYISFSGVKEVEDKVIIIDSISKRYSACGARIGCIASKNTGLMKEVLKLCQSRLCSPTLEQVGAASLINVPGSYFRSVVFDYERRRDTVYNALTRMNKVVCIKPSGAFYIIAKLPIDDAEKFSKWLLTDFSIDNETVMVTPAKGFYASKDLGINEIRISYALNVEKLERAMNILEKGLKEYCRKFM